MTEKEFTKKLIIGAEKRHRRDVRIRAVVSVLYYAVIIFLIFFMDDFENFFENLIAALAGGVAICVASAIKNVVLFNGLDEEARRIRGLKEKYVREFLEPGEIPFWEE